MRNGTSWGRKEKACTDEEKEEHGDHWDHVVIDAESKAVISMVCGKRTKEDTEELIQDLASRCNDGNPPELFTTDNHSCYNEYECVFIRSRSNSIYHIIKTEQTAEK